MLFGYFSDRCNVTLLNQDELIHTRGTIAERHRKEKDRHNHGLLLVGVCISKLQTGNRKHDLRGGQNRVGE